jgi:hypothetical protein
MTTLCRARAAFAVVSIQLACCWTGARAEHLELGAGLDDIVVSVHHVNWRYAYETISQHWGFQSGQDHFRFHQYLDIYYREAPWPLGRNAIALLPLDVAARLSDRSWLRLGITPCVDYYRDSVFSYADLYVTPNAMVMVNAYHPDFLARTGPGDYGGPGLIVEGNAEFSPQQSAVSTSLRVRGPWTWFASHWTLEAGPHCELSQWVSDGSALGAWQELGFQALGILGVRAEEARLHPDVYLVENSSGQIGLDVSWHDDAQSDASGFWRRTANLKVTADGAAWLRVWRGLVIEPGFSLHNDRLGGWSFSLIPRCGAAYIARASGGHLLGRVLVVADDILLGHWSSSLVTVFIGWQN